MYGRRDFIEIFAAALVVAAFKDSKLRWGCAQTFSSRIFYNP